MKKITYISSLIFLFPILAFATSGACSGHGGVSCSVGSDSDGSVICNDGWRNSKVAYSSMVMCQGYLSKPSVAPKTITVTSPPKPKTVTVVQPKKAVIVPPVPIAKKIDKKVTLPKNKIQFLP